MLRKLLLVQFYVEVWILSVSLQSSGDCSRPQNQDTTALYVSGKLPTNPSLKPTLTLISHLGQNVGLGGGVGWQLPRNVCDTTKVQCSVLVGAL